MIITIKEYKASTFSTNRKYGKAKTNTFKGYSTVNSK